jgi:hypothetical protein
MRSDCELKCEASIFSVMPGKNDWKNYSAWN